jgi:hypothetical protein
MKREVVKSDL